MFYYQSRTYSAQTPPIEHRASYACERCGEELHALAQAVGYGTATASYDFSGGSPAHQQTAAQRAYDNAQTQLHRAFVLVRCPACGEPSSAGAAEIAAHEARARRRRKLAMILAPGLALAAFAIGAYPALRELRHSAGLLVMVLACAVAAATGVLSILVWPRNGALRPIAYVWHWRAVPSPEGYRANAIGASAWREASFAGCGPFGTTWGAVGSACLACAAGLTAVVGLVVHESQFETVIYATDAPVGTEVRAASSQGEAARFTVRLGKRDGFYSTFKVRKSEVHELVVTSTAPEQPSKVATYGLPANASHGWLLAAYDRPGTCFVEQTVHYAKYGTPPPATVVRLRDSGGGVYVPTAHPDHVFEDSPKTISLGKNESSAQRVELRAWPCDDLDERD